MEGRPEMTIEVVDDAHAVVTRPHLMVCLWRTVTSREAVAEIRQIARRHAQAHPPMAMLTVLEAEAEQPGGDVLRELAALFQDLEHSVSCSALTFEGDGFSAAAVRGVATGLQLLAKQTFPHQVFARVSEAADWMGQHDPNLSAADVMESMRKVREALHGRSGPSLGA